MWEHKNHVHPHSFTARYNITQLVYYECYASVNRAIARETEMKKWNRAKKIALIVASNPTWRDLSLEWGTKIEPQAPDFVPKKKGWGAPWGFVPPPAEYRGSSASRRNDGRDGMTVGTG